MDFYSKFVNLLVDFTVFIVVAYVIVSIPMTIKYTWKLAGSLDMFIKYYKQKDENSYQYKLWKEELVGDLQKFFISVPGFIIGNLIFIKVLSGV